MLRILGTSLDVVAVVVVVVVVVVAAAASVVAVLVVVVVTTDVAGFPMCRRRLSDALIEFAVLLGSQLLDLSVTTNEKTPLGVVNVRTTTGRGFELCLPVFRGVLLWRLDVRCCETL